MAAGVFGGKQTMFFHAFRVFPTRTPRSPGRRNSLFCWLHAIDGAIVFSYSQCEAQHDRVDVCYAQHQPTRIGVADRSRNRGGCVIWHHVLTWPWFSACETGPMRLTVRELGTSIPAVNGSLSIDTADTSLLMGRVLGTFVLLSAALPTGMDVCRSHRSALRR